MTQDRNRIAALLQELKSLAEPARLQRVETFLVEDASTEERAGLAALFLTDWRPEFDRSPALVALRRERVGDPFDAVAYEARCREWAADEYALCSWLEVGEVLGGRPGWHFEIANTGEGEEVLWAFGLAGAFRLVLSLAGGGYMLYDHAADIEHHFRGCSDLQAWLGEHESEHEGLTGGQREMIDYLLPHEVAKWEREGER